MTITLLDGGMGQELIHRSKLPATPLWSANVMMNEPEIVEAVHKDFIEAGAQYIALNTYSATPERLARDASEDLFEPLQAQAIAIAQRAVEGTDVKITGCLPPLYGSYRPDVAPDFDSCLETYKRVVDCQKHAVEVVLCETMSSIREATAATTAIKQAGLTAWCAVSVAEQDGLHLRSGESIIEAVEAIKQAGADAILINCSPPEAVSTGIKAIADCGLPFGAYANGFTKADDLQLGGTVDNLKARTDLDPQAYADFCAQWIEDGATIIGGCCEVGPDHIRELHKRFI